MKKKIKILDCTLRDGGYYNKWDFNKDIYKKYFSSIKKSNVDAVEIGFRFLPRNYNLGPFAYSSDLFLNKNNIKHSRLAIMINASELIEAKKENYKFFFSKKVKSPVKIIRIACHLIEYKKIKKILSLIKKNGYEIHLNLMQISEYSEEVLNFFFNKIDKKNIDVFYFADSFGSLDPKKVAKICKVIKKYWRKEFGIHSHDNKGLALKNCIEAYKNGATWFDGTIQGMGRGAGNVTTENLYKYFNKIEKKYLPKKIKTLSLEFRKLKNKYKWGKSDLYKFAANKSIHPTYVQNFLENKYLSTNRIKIILNDLSIINARKYDFDIFNKYLEKSSKITKFSKHNFRGIFKKKDILILANGPSVKKNIDAIHKFILTKKPVVLTLNFIPYIKKKLVNFIVVSHYEKLLEFRSIVKKNLNKIIVPKERLKKINKSIDTIHIKYNYGIMTKKNTFKVYKNYCILPNNLVFTYSIALCKIGNAGKIYLAGFDGYEANSFRNNEMAHTIKIIKNNYKNNMISLFKTPYSIDDGSVCSPVI
jgi:4-hydroxy 2-oxovalerate aldolase